MVGHIGRVAVGAERDAYGTAGCVQSAQECSILKPTRIGRSTAATGHNQAIIVRAVVRPQIARAATGYSMLSRTTSSTKGSFGRSIDSCAVAADINVVLGATSYRKGAERVAADSAKFPTTFCTPGLNGDFCKIFIRLSNEIFFFNVYFSSILSLYFDIQFSFKLSFI